MILATINDNVNGKSETKKHDKGRLSLDNNYSDGVEANRYNPFLYFVCMI